MVAQTAMVMVMSMKLKKVMSLLTIALTHLARLLRTSTVVLIPMVMAIQMMVTLSLMMKLNGKIVMTMVMGIIQQVPTLTIAPHAGVTPH